VSETAILKYYQHYKKLEKVLDQNQFTQTIFSTITHVLEQTQLENLLPSKFGLVKASGSED
jgi:hypothetical protein